MTTSFTLLLLLLYFFIPSIVFTISIVIVIVNIIVIIHYRIRFELRGGEFISSATMKTLTDRSFFLARREKGEGRGREGDPVHFCCVTVKST